MLPRDRRIPSSFFRLKPEEKGRPRTSHSPFLTARAYRSHPAESAEPALDPTRLAVVVPKKVDRRAVGRNRLKRRIAEILRRELPRVRPGYRVIFLAKKAAAEADHQSLEEAVRQTLRELKVTPSDQAGLDS